ncbi:MAG: SurA N-terminal domain-containing protein [Mariprofundaceae bacterium]
MRHYGGFGSVPLPLNFSTDKPEITMLETMRTQAQSWIAKIILGGVALSFVLWGVGDYFLGGGQIQTVAEVDDSGISDMEYYQALERTMNKYRSLLGEQFSSDIMRQLDVKNETLQTLINRRLILMEADNMDLVVPEHQVLSRVKGDPVFQSGGAFDPNRYAIMVRNLGYRAPADFEQQLRLDLLAEALQRAIMDSVAVSDQEVRQRYAESFETRELAALVVDPLSFISKAEASEDGARSFYENNAARYRAPLRLTLAMVDINASEISRDIQVDEDEIVAAYENQRAGLTTPEQRRARHILVRLAQFADETAKKAAHEKIEAAQARIEAGEDFAELAKQVSEDVTAADGGDLGFFARGSMVPTFEAAVFAMQEGEVSDVVESPFGLHLIQLVEIRAEKAKPLEEMRGQLAATLQAERAEDEAYNLSQDLDDALGREGALATAANSLNMALRDIGPISQDEALADPVLTLDKSLRQKVFTMNPGDAVDIHQLDDGRYVAIEVLAREEPAVLPFAKVAAQVYADARREAAGRLAEKEAASLLERAKTEGLEALAAESSQPLFISKPVRSNSVGDDAPWLSKAVLNQAFAMLKGQVAPKVITVPSGLAILQIRDVIAAPEEDFAKQEASIRRELVAQKGAVRFSRWISSVRNRHEISINQTVLDRI